LWGYGVLSFVSIPGSLEAAPSPFREALLQSLRVNEIARQVIFSWEFSAGKFRTLASVLCVTSQRWIMVFKQTDGRVTIDAASFEETLLIELTIILLYGKLKIDFVKDGEVRSAVLHFNTVIGHLYCEAIYDILDAIDRQDRVADRLDQNSRSMLRDWPLKFQNVAIIYAPRRSRLLDAVHWETFYARFRREITPAAAVLLTTRHIIFVSEEKALRRWFDFGRTPKYGQIITYLPRQRIKQHEILKDRRVDTLVLELGLGLSTERLKILLPPGKRNAGSRLVEKAEPSL
jgi:hypothetical protein